MQQVVNGETMMPPRAAVASQSAAEPLPDPQSAPGALRERAAEASRPNEEAVLGQIALLLLRSPEHRTLFLQDLEWRILPPLRLGQARLIVRDDRPFAFVSWAFLNAENAARMAAGNARLRPADWKSGEEPWLVDLIAPPGAAESVLKAIEQSLDGLALKRRV